MKEIAWMLVGVFCIFIGLIVYNYGLLLTFVGTVIVFWQAVLHMRED